MICKHFQIVIIIGFLFYGSTTESKEFCHKMLGEVANAQMNFVGCTVKNSSPANSCLECITWHSDMIDKYKILVSNKTCANEMLNKNRLNILYNMQKDLVDVWNKGFCDDCFLNGNETNETEKFFNYTIDFDDCIAQSSKNNACLICVGKYEDLNTFYKHMDEKKQGQICFDAQDKMNRTRSLWSKDLNCCHREYNFMFFTIASSLFASLPIFFYLGMYGYTKRMERNHEVLDADLTTEHASTSTGIQARGTTSIIEERTSPIEEMSSDEEMIDDLKKQRDTSTLEKTLKQNSVHPVNVNNPNIEILQPITTSSNETGTLIDL